MSIAYYNDSIRIFSDNFLIFLEIFSQYFLLLWAILWFVSYLKFIYFATTIVTIYNEIRRLIFLDFH